MELFGVQELPNSKSITAPGWAYVPDTGLNPAAASLQPSSRKRAARNQPNASVREHTAKQDAKILRDLAALDKESYKDVQIPVPIRQRDNAGRVSHVKVTPAVRKILQSQKTFANHLSDAEALAALAASQPQAAPPPVTSISRASPASTPRPTATSRLTSTGKRSHKKKDPNATGATPLRKISTQNSVAPATPNSAIIKSESSINDVTMSDAPDIPVTSILAALPASLELQAHPGDHDPLLMSHIPYVPSDAELEALIAAPPLTYLEARGALNDENLRQPLRHFCEICGFWGRVRCTKCGTRVCALECLRTHKEDCYTRYGA